MRRTLPIIIFLFLAGPARGQSIWINTPIHTNNQFNRALPMQTWQCSAPQATLGTHQLEFLDTDGTVNGYVDCHGNIAGGGLPTPGAPSGSLQYNNAGAFGGVPNSSVDSTSGDITMGAGIFATSTDGQYLGDASVSGIDIDASLGTGLLELTSAGGIALLDNSAPGINIIEYGVSNIALETSGEASAIIIASEGNLVLAGYSTGLLLQGPTTTVNLENTTAGALTVNAFIVQPPIHFSELPESPVTGMIQNVDDANAGTFGATITAGGGGFFCIALYDGTQWTCH